MLVSLPLQGEPQTFEGIVDGLSGRLFGFPEGCQGRKSSRWKSQQQQDSVPGTDSVGSQLWCGERRGPGWGQQGQGAIAAPQGQYQSLGESMSSGRAEHGSVLPSTSLHAAWSLDCLPRGVKSCSFPQPTAHRWYPIRQVW